MGLLRKLLGPGNSLLFLFDHVTEEVRWEMEELITETRKFYEFAKLSDVVGKKGKAAILFRNPRKSVVLRAVPLLRGEDVPFTIFLRPDCIGTNRLPAEEEEGWRQNGLDKLNELDPTRFFATWKNLVELTPRLFEPGVHLYDARPESAAETATFIRQQMGVGVRVAFSPEQFQHIDRTLTPLGIECLVTPRLGAIDRDTNPFDLPVWPVEKNEEEKEPSPAVEDR